jgi:hypothetical protein
MVDFVAHPSKWRIFLLILGSIAFVVFFLWIIGAFGPPPVLEGRGSTRVRYFAWVGIFCFGLCGIVCIKMLFDNDVQVRINAAGIYWKRWSDATIPWAEITEVSVWEVHYQRSIILNLKNPDRYSSTTIMGRLASVNRSMTGGDIAITLSGTTGGFDDAMATIGHYCSTDHAF